MMTKSISAEVTLETITSSTFEDEKISPSAAPPPNWWSLTASAFCTATPIHGFSFAVSSSSKLERFFWVVCIMVFASLTVKEFIGATMDYLNEPTVTSVHLQTNYRLDFPNITLCVPIIQSLYVKNKQTNSQNFRNPFPTSLDIFSDVEVDEFLVHFASESNLLEILSYENYRNGDKPRSLFILTVQALAQVTSVEGQHFKEITGMDKPDRSPSAMDRDFNWKYAPLYKATSNQSVSLTSAFYKTMKLYERKGVEVRQLLERVGDTLCSIFDITVAVETHGGSFINYESRNCSELKPTLTWFSVLPFPVKSSRDSDINACYRLPGVTLMPNQYAEVSLQPENLYNESSLTEAEKAKNLIAFLDMMGSPTVPFYNKRALSIQIPPKTYTVMGVEMFGEFIHHATRRAPCSLRSSHLTCRGRCRAEYMLKHCGCWPLMWFSEPKPSSAAYCPYFNGSSISNHVLPPTSLCHYATRTQDPDEACASACLDSCQMRIMISFGHDSAWSYGRSLVYLKGKRFHYPVFEEQLKVDLNTYLSNAGGTLGLWLGASFLGLIHLAVCLLRNLVVPSVRQLSSSAFNRKMFRGKAGQFFQRFLHWFSGIAEPTKQNENSHNGSAVWKATDLPPCTCDEMLIGMLNNQGQATDLSQNNCCRTRANGNININSPWQRDSKQNSDVNLILYEA